MSSNQKSNKKEGIWLSIIGSIFGWLVLIWIGYWIYDANFATHTHYTITGLGEFKLGDKCRDTQDERLYQFMSFNKVCWRATIGSLKRYCVYYEGRFTLDDNQGQERLVKFSKTFKSEEVEREISQLADTLRKKYFNCNLYVDFMAFPRKDRPWSKEEIRSVGLDDGGDRFCDNWTCIFDAEDQGRHVALYVTDDATYEKPKYHMSNESKGTLLTRATEKRVVVIAYDQKLIDLNKIEESDRL